VAVVEHEALRLVTYPYEWSFGALKAAALLHLDVHLEALTAGFTLCDGSAYNVQFIGPRPVFIDLLSLRGYEEGSYWLGHRQFCEQFLNPLLLRSALGVAHNAYLRGSLEGIPAEVMARLLPIRWALRWTVFANVILPARLQHRARKGATNTAARSSAGLSLPVLQGLLRQLRRFIAGLEPRRSGGIWEDYARANSYNSEAYDRKRAFVKRFASAHRPAMLLDLGCNTGDFSIAALDSGAGSAIGFEGDADTLEIAYRRVSDGAHAFLPLYQDLANLAPSQGWNGRERTAVQDRIKVDAVLALAVLHHLALARNVPLAWALDWVVGLAPRGVVEFVPPDDPMAVQLLGRRSADALGYSEASFVHHLSQRAAIRESTALPGSGRRLYAFER
jgi:ribosomal protein L11 methylase PrmA